MRGDRVRIGTPEHPSRPASGGILDVFPDRSFLSHRRDGGTKVHPWYNGIPSGFPSTKEDFEDVRLLQRREGAEESIVMVKDNQTILFPICMDLYCAAYMGSIKWNEKVHHIEKGFIEERIALLGLKNKPSTGAATVTYNKGFDLLEIRENTDHLISKTGGNIYLSWEIETNVAIAGVRGWFMHGSETITAFDGEGFFDKDGKFVHLNREKFHIYPHEVANVPFGAEIPMPKRYQLKKTEEGIGIAELVPPREGEEYYFKPDDGLRRMLDALHIPGWEGNWIKYEIAEAEKRLAELQRR